MMDKLVELVVSGIILVIGVGIVLVLWGADPEVATSLITGVTKLGVYILLAGVLISILVALIR